MSTGQSTEAIDAIELLTTDHARVEQLFVQLESGSLDPGTRQSLISEVVRELSVHAAIEEQVLYPVMRESLPDGDELVDHAIQEHQEVKDTLAELEKQDGSTTTPLLTDLISSVRHHVEEEEGELFPRLDTAVGEDRLLQMGDAMAKAKKLAPTHPHPNAPNEPPGNMVAGPVAGLVDRVKDAFSKDA